MQKSKQTLMILVITLVINSTTAATIQTSQKITAYHSSFVSTPVNFGKPFLLTFNLPIKQGILLCNQSGDTCQIAAMPLLWQGDQQINQELDQYLGGVPPEQLQKDTSGNPSVIATRDAIKGNACYNTSITTIQIAALANRDQAALPLSGRTDEFNNIQANNGATKPVRQLIWAMKKQFEGEHCKSGLPPAKCTQSFYLHETVADTNNGKILENCNPYLYGNCAVATAMSKGDGSKKINDPKASSQLVGTAFRQFNPTNNDISNEKLIALMQQGYAPLIAYHRYIPVLLLDKKTGVLTVTFNNKPENDAGMHKIAVSGYQPGTYPILINDVGNGQRYKVRVSSNLSELKFSTRQVTDATIKPTIKFVKIDPNYENIPFLIYEDEDKKINPRIFFIEHFDAIKLKTSEQINHGTPVINQIQ